MPWCGDSICGAAPPEESGDRPPTTSARSRTAANFIVEWDATGIAKVKVT
jgi:hypothetical protein